MVVITIRKWKRKLVVVLVAVVFLVSLGLGVGWFLEPDDNPAAAPSDNLKNDVLTQPVKVQGQPASPDIGEQPVQTQPKSK